MTNYLNDLLGAYDRLIMDPVHGGISLYGHEVQVIDHPLFQRLRFICQNDILSLVFPGATHSRFLHSIGTMHTGGRMFRTMVAAHLADRSQRGLKDIPVEYLPALDYVHKVTRLACLLHDCGHSSFSHQFTKAHSIRDLLSEPGRFRQLWQDDNQKPLSPSARLEEPATLEHEHYSVRCAWQILQDIDLPHYGIDPVDVLGVMETANFEPSDLFRQYADSFWRFISGRAPSEGMDTASLLKKLISLIVSGEIDADRADYMLRDGFHSSVTIGGFNLDHLLNNLRVGWDTETNWLGLAITAKGLGALEDFVYSRHQMYRKVYGHKTSIGFDWLLRRAIDEVLEDQDCRDYVDECLKDLREFRHLTDNYFWELFRRKSKQSEKSFSRRLIDRRKLNHLLTRENLEPGELEQVREDLARHYKVEPEMIVSCTLRARFSKIQENFNDIKVLSREPLSKALALKQITDVSSFFSKFSDGNITHFYLHPLEDGLVKASSFSP